MFDLLIKHFRKAAGIRNEIAHGRVIKFNINNTDYGYFLAAPSYWTRKTESFSATTSPDGFKKLMEKFATDKLAGLGSDYRYTSAEVIHYEQKFRTMIDWLVEYFDVLWPIAQRHPGFH